MPARSVVEDVVEGLPDAVALVDREFRFRYINAATEQLYGQSRSEVIGQRMWDMFPAARGTEAYEACQRAMRDRVTLQYETYWAPWGRWYEVTVVPSGDGLAFQFRDITQRKRTDALVAGQRHALELAVRGASLREILEELVLTIERHVEDGTLASIQLVVDGKLRHGAAPHLPDAYNAEIDGLAIGPAVGSCGTAAFTGELVIARDLETDPRWQAFVPLTRQHGLRSCWSMPIRSRDETIVGTTALYRRAPGADPTPAQIDAIRMLANTAALVIERDREARALAEAKTSAERANRAKDEFLAMLGHELRNPLSPIVTALQLMELRADDGTRAARTVIARQVDHLIRLVDDLLDVSRITSGRIALKLELVDIADVAARALEMTSAMFAQRRHQLVVNVERHLFVTGDATRLAQVIANLLTNAAKYSDPGARITLTAARRGEHIAIEVRDTGIGIAPDVLPRVFDVFAQAEQAVERAQGGLGLGLAIVKNLVAMHGGTVRAESPGLGEGSTFTLELPAAAVAVATPSPRSTRALGAAQIARRILVVDDNEDIAEMMADMLGEVGHVVRVARDGASAIAETASFGPHVVLLDIGLPVMDGYEVARELRAQPRDQPLYLIAITGYGQGSDRERTRAAGFDAHLVKPVKVEAVLGMIDQLGR